MKVAIILIVSGLASAARRGTKATTDHAQDQAWLFNRRRRTSRYASLTWEQHFGQYMDDLKTTANPDGFNANCEPYIAEPENGVESKGLIILQHGYTACPYFWYLLTPELVKQGWTVMAPLAPGHGRAPRIEPNGTQEGRLTYLVTDYSQELPSDGEAYEEFSQELLAISSKYKKSNSGKKLVLAGCSHGAAIASFMVMNGEVGAFDRVMLMNPFLAPPNEITSSDWSPSVLRRILPIVLPALKFLREDGDRVYFEKHCDEKRWPGNPRQGGCHGYCQFDLINYRAVLEFGNAVEAEARSQAAKGGLFSGGLIDRVLGLLELVKHKAWQVVTRSDQAQSDFKVQLLTTSKDGAISNSRVHFTAEAIGRSVPGQSSAYCVLNQEFEHTFINQGDKPLDKDMWWLDRKRVVGGKNMVDLLAGFLTEGNTFEVNGVETEDEELLGDPLCDVQQLSR